jgi:splicing factor 45
MASQQHQQQQAQAQKAQGLPNPYAPSLPNPYAAATVASSAPVKFSEEQAKAEQKKAPGIYLNCSASCL